MLKLNIDLTANFKYFCNSWGAGNEKSVYINILFMCRRPQCSRRGLKDGDIKKRRLMYCIG